MQPYKTRTWLLIADGSRAKVFESVRARNALHEIDDMALAIDLPKSGEILADKPGRTFDSVGAGCHAKENPTDPHRHLKRNFASKVLVNYDARCWQIVSTGSSWSRHLPFWAICAKNF